jgi:hypothetical protein
MRAFLRLLGIVIGLLAAPTAAVAHEVRPALLQITELAPGRYDIVWKRPILGDVALRLKPRLSSGWLDGPPADQFAGAGYLVARWGVTSDSPLHGQDLAIEGLEQSITDVLVQVRAQGRSVDFVVKPVRPRATLSLEGRAAPAAPAYLRLGVEHILGGIDHLLFVLGLLLLTGPRWSLVKAVTAFTAAHSLTLAASALGWVSPPSSVVEALVALSIVFLAVELARGPQSGTLTRRHPWMVALVFGLLHGFAFAGALAEVGLPRDDLVPALFLFNVGVELGQLLFVAAAVAAMWVAARILRPAAAPAPLRLAPAYGIGAFAAFWFLERVGETFA